MTVILHYFVLVLYIVERVQHFVALIMYLSDSAIASGRCPYQSSLKSLYILFLNTRYSIRSIEASKRSSIRCLFFLYRTSPYSKRCRIGPTLVHTSGLTHTSRLRHFLQSVGFIQSFIFKDFGDCGNMPGL